MTGFDDASEYLKGKSSLAVCEGDIVYTCAEHCAVLTCIGGQKSVCQVSEEVGG